MKELNVLTLPLVGRILVEANAGTGKTWSVTGIYLRLLVETELEIQQILVMTFTRAAAAELRVRLRARIALMLARLEDVEDDNSQDQLIEQLLATVPDRARAVAKLSACLQTFDLAAVYTIHGFCNQVLSRFDFSTGFDGELDTVENELEYLEPLIRAGWRDLCRHFSPGFAEFVVSKQLDCMNLGRRCVEQWERPWRDVICATDLGAATQSAELALDAAALGLQQCWIKSELEVVTLLEQSKDLHARSYNPKTLHRAYEQIQRVRSGQRYFKAAALTDLARLGADKLTAACRKNAQPPEHPLFDLVDRFVGCVQQLTSAYQLRYRALWLELATLICADRIELKKKLRIRSYSDLLLDLQTALDADRSGQLAASISAQYPAALVDEFQDTDPAQYDVLARIYRQLEAPVIFVGDPKQALYGFRGADVFTYLEARKQATQIFSLSANWRAVPRLIKQINALFSICREPFLISELAYQPSSVGAVDKPALMIDEQPAPALEFLLLPGNEKGARANKDDTTQWVAARVASEIADLIDKGQRGQARIGTEPLQASDIAVLVRNHKQAQVIARALSEHSVSCTQIGTGSVWLSSAAFDLALICRAMYAPEAHGAVAAALSTSLLGVTAAEIWALHDEEKKMDRELSRFVKYGRLWIEQGLSAAMQQLMSDFEVTRQLLAHAMGERCLTNISHLLDLLQAHAFASRCTPGELLEWFTLQRLGSGTLTEEALLRLESDQDLVQVLTIHKSKGLQFPVVYCPFLWAASSSFESIDWVEFHQLSGSRQASLDLGGPDYDQHREQSLVETFAEEVRVLYVALTRAIHHCVVVWGQAVGAENSALRQLLHSDPADSGWRSGRSAFLAMTPAQVRSAVGSQLDQAGIAWRFHSVADGGRIHNAPSADTALGVLARKFQGRIPRVWQVHSYSSIAAHDGYGVRDHDATVGRIQAATAEHERLNIFDLPGGPDIGSMFHEILEELSCFSASTVEIVELTRIKAHKYGLDPVYLELVATQVSECLHTPLNVSDPALSLAAIESGERIVEMEFHLPMAACKRQEISRIARLRPASGQLEKGFLRGFIDLVFRYKERYFIVDYKSNHLGNSQSDYRPEALRLAIRSSDYDLQYHLYCVAVHRFLGQRLAAYDYEHHFGGVYYLYLRGMRKLSGPGTGVFFERPDWSVIDRLDQLFRADSPADKF